MSMAITGPFKFRKYANRAAKIALLLEVILPPPGKQLIISLLSADKHPDLLSFTVSPYPASSKAFQDSWSSNRCLGSMVSASRGEISKNKGSNSLTPEMQPHHLQLVFPGSCAGITVIFASQTVRGVFPGPYLSGARIDQSSSIFRAPGNRPLMPMMAIGSKIPKIDLPL